MKERPILFSAPMVRALLDGTKTQTRRVVKGIDPANLSATMTSKQWAMVNRELPEVVSASYFCPYGKTGDRLWVRETCWIADGAVDRGGVAYCADHDGLTMGGMKKRPSIHMPRWASRILLEIVGVHVERLRDITLRDVCKEGLARSIYEFTPVTSGFGAFEELWESINGAGSWNANPWVWVVEFKRVMP